MIDKLAMQPFLLRTSTNLSHFSCKNRKILESRRTKKQKITKKNPHTKHRRVSFRACDHVSVSIFMLWLLPLLQQLLSRMLFHSEQLRMIFIVSERNEKPMDLPRRRSLNHSADSRNENMVWKQLKLVTHTLVPVYSP